LLDVTEKPAMFAGGHGLMSTAADYARFCQMLLNGGVLDGARILGPKTVAYMASDHLGGEISKAGTLYLPGPGYGFGLGFGVRLATGESPWPGSKGEYYWGGYAGTYFWIDPVERMVVVYMMQSVKHRLHYRMLLRNLVMQAIIEPKS
ncbi:MAG: serine hydrolase domain-containing protein, partial [Alphaproteobacteria bacterium]